jgi:D-alanine-D-alanine ligase
MPYTLGVEGRRGRIVVLKGGQSAERDVSLASGAAVATALESSGHRVCSVDPAQTSLWEFQWLPDDVVFIALHGEFGEDGQVQELLESLRLPYTGSDSEASRLAFSKSAAKVRFLQRNVPTPPFVLIHHTDPELRIRRVAERVGFPLVVKPDAQGSSLGVSLVRTPRELMPAVQSCFGYGPFGLLEQAVLGTEWTLAMLDDAPLPLIQIGTSHTLFDFEAKYRDEATTCAFEFAIPPGEVARIVDAGRRACEALETTGLARVDLRLDESRRPWVLEVNTVPGMTDHSLVPKAAAQAGLSLGALCERALESALRRQHAARQTEPELRIRHNRTVRRHAG